MSEPDVVLDDLLWFGRRLESPTRIIISAEGWRAFSTACREHDVETNFENWARWRTGRVPFGTNQEPL